MRGGALVSVLHDYSQHRDPAIRSLLLHILSQVSGCGQGVVVGTLKWNTAHCLSCSQSIEVFFYVV